jgi:hypothetical protein
MQFERFESLNLSVVAWFAHLHQVRFEANSHKSGEVFVVATM